MELLIIITVIGILASILLPSLSQGRFKAQEAVCKSNLNQMLLGQMLYSKENRSRVFATFYGAEWMKETGWRGADAVHQPNEDFHDGNTGFLEPYCGDRYSLIYQCPATDYDITSDVYRIDEGRSYEGFMQRNSNFPELLENVYFARQNDRLFENASRKPFFWDYTAPINSVSDGGNMKNLGTTTVHGNSGRLNLALTDSSVITISFPVAHWTLFNDNNWIPYFESALGESAN